MPASGELKSIGLSTASALTPRRLAPLRSAVVTAAFGIFSIGCDEFRESDQSLRVQNVGTIPLTELRVIFPSSETAFGDIAAGATSQYLSIDGVYSYSAFRFKYQGQEIAQPVIDWVGEEPMPGRKFTYNVELVVPAQGSPRINLQGSVKDQ